MAGSKQAAPKPDKPRKPKKPYHIRRSDLDLDGYKKDLQDRSPGRLFRRAVAALGTSRQFYLYLLLQCLAAAVGYGQVMLCVGILWAFVVNTGRRKAGEMSAYSLFNDNVEAIDGATNMEYLDRELRRQLY